MKKNKTLSELNLNEIKKIEPRVNDNVLDVFNLNNSINSKKSYGGTSFDVNKKMISKYKKRNKNEKKNIILIIFFFIFLISCGKR